jgi:hypothetical protein
VRGLRHPDRRDRASAGGTGLGAPAGLCGGGNGNDASKGATGEQTTTAPEGTATAPAQPRVDKAADMRVARAGRLRMSDFPSGWQQSDEDQQSKTGNCDAIKQAKAAATVCSSSPSFSKGDNTVAQNATYVFADDAAAHTAFQALSSRATRLCYAEEVGKVFTDEYRSSRPGDTSQATVGKPTTGEISIDRVGDERSAGA